MSAITIVIALLVLPLVGLKWSTVLIAIALLLLAWIGLNLKTSRKDGDLIKGVHKYRKMMWYIMPTRNESVVYYDTYVKADKLLEYLEQVNKRFHVDVTHMLIAAGLVGLIETPKMNRFVIGRRMYQRKGNWVTFSMKRKKKDEDAKLAAVKMEQNPEESFKQFCERVATEIEVQRSDKKTGHDKEYDLLTAIPRPLLRAGVALFRWLDYHNFLLHSFIRDDPMYTSMFIANLGSVKMAPGFHHLYEWGTCPLFLMVGQIEERPIVVNGQVEMQKVLPLRWTYDERIDDGLSSRRGIIAANCVLEDPFTYLGCLAEDGSDEFPIGQKRIPEEVLRV